jgi:PASTA domain/NPCBM/NEW2 domain
MSLLRFSRRSFQRLAVISVMATLGACGGSNGSSGSAMATAAGTQVANTVTSSTAAGATSLVTVPPLTVATTIAPTTTAKPKLMPDLVGQTESQARELLRAANVSDIRVTTVEHARAPGTVLKQVPTAKSELSDQVDLVVTKAVAPVPNFVGQPVEDLSKWLNERGITLKSEKVVTEETPEGRVVSMTPGAGQSVGFQMVIGVATPPTSTFLSAMGTVEVTESGQWKSGNVAVNATTKPTSLYWESGGWFNAPSTYRDYNLSKGFSRLKAVLGVEDNSKSGFFCRFEVFLDGKPVPAFNESVGLGGELPMDVDVSNVLRMRINVSTSGKEAGICVLGTARLLATAPTPVSTTTAS